MDIRRIILYMALVMVGLSLWNAWKIEYPSNPPVAEAPKTETSPEAQLLPQVDSTAESPQPVVATSEKHEEGQIIAVHTDVLNIGIDLKHGNIISAQLLDYPLSLDEKDKPFSLLQNNSKERYVANSSLFAASGGKIEPFNFNFTSAHTQYQLDPNQKQLVVTLDGYHDGIQVQKNFVFNKASYLIGVNYKIANNSENVWKAYFNTQFVRTSPPEDKSSIFHVGSYTGGSYSNPGQHKYQKVEFSDMTKANLDVDVKGGWIAMQQHYFLTAWVPKDATVNKFYTRAVNNKDYTIGAVSQPVIVPPKQQQEVGAKLYVGPEKINDLKTIAPYLDLTVDYGILWILSSSLFYVMSVINSFVGNWGWTIVLVTVLIKLAFYRLSARSYKSMAGMRKLQPKLQALKDRYGDDKAKISQATMELYRQEKVNPLGGCLPILVQIPVFIALYWVLLESVELRQSPFILWIKDLSAADPYYILPVIMGLTMFVQQKLNPAPPDPTQAKVMMFLPLLFTGLFLSFPAGLVLYWIVNNTLSILQQWYITHKYSDEKPVSKKKLATTTK